jgi:hypothetical protein
MTDTAFPAKREDDPGSLDRTFKSDAPDVGFEVFQAKKKARQLADGEVSLTKSNILLSEKLAERFGKARWVVLLYNRQTHELGIRPASPEESGYKISGRAISSRSFFQHFGIKDRGRYKVGIAATGMLVVALATRQS